LLQRYPSQLVVVNVQKTGKNLPAEQVSGKDRLEQVLKDTDHSYVIIEDNNIEHGLQQFVASHKPEILTMVAHKHNLMERFFGTHHTKEMIYKTEIPILILQDKD
jgi:hypothetical protein